MISSIWLGSRMSGTKPAPIPWIGWGPGWPPDSTGLAAGSTATIRRPGLRGLSTSPHAGNRAAGADAGDHGVDLACVSCQISSAVVRAVDRGVGGVAELVRLHRAGLVGEELSGPRDGAPHALLPRRKLNLGTEKARASCGARRTRSRHGEDQPVTARGTDESETDAGIAGRGLDEVAPGRSRPSASMASIIPTPIRSLTQAMGLKNSSFRRSAAIPSSAQIGAYAPRACCRWSRRCCRRCGRGGRVEPQRAAAPACRSSLESPPIPRLMVLCSNRRRQTKVPCPLGRPALGARMAQDRRPARGRSRFEQEQPWPNDILALIVDVRQCRVDVRGGAYGIPDGWPAMCACRQQGRAIALSATIGGAYIINCHLNQQIEIVAAESRPK